MNAIDLLKKIFEMVYYKNNYILSFLSIDISIEIFECYFIYKFIQNKKQKLLN